MTAEKKPVPVEHSRFTTIQGLSEQRRLPRLGKLHLGKKVMSPGAKSEYPKATDYFVVENTSQGKAVEKAYGQNPRELTVLLPTDDPHEFFPQEYKSYKGGVGKWCHGDGVRAQRVMEGGGWQDISCPGMGDVTKGLAPCPIFAEKKCKVMANLMVVLPFVSMYGVFQIDTSSLNSIVDINSGIDAIRRAAQETGTSVNHIPATLRIVTRQVSPDGKRKAVHTMVLTVASYHEIVKIKKQLAEIREALGGNVTLSLPPPEQSRFEETDLIPESIQGEVQPATTIIHDDRVEEPVDAEVVNDSPASEPAAPPAPGLRITPPDSLSKDQKNGWITTMALAKDMGLKDEDVLLSIAQDLTKGKQGSLEELSLADWRAVWKHLAEIKGKGGTLL